MGSLPLKGAISANSSGLLAPVIDPPEPGPESPQIARWSRSAMVRWALSTKNNDIPRRLLTRDETGPPMGGAPGAQEIGLVLLGTPPDVGAARGSYAQAHAHSDAHGLPTAGTP